MLPLNLWWKITVRSCSTAQESSCYSCFLTLAWYFLQNSTTHRCSSEVFWQVIKHLNYLKATGIKKRLPTPLHPCTPFPQSEGEHFITHGLARTHSYTYKHSKSGRSVHHLLSLLSFSPLCFKSLSPKPFLWSPWMQGQRSLRPPQLSSNPAEDSMAYSSLFLIRCWSQNSGSLSRFMQVLAVGRRSRSVPPLWMQKTGYSSCVHT